MARSYAPPPTRWSRHLSAPSTEETGHSRGKRAAIATGEGRRGRAHTHTYTQTDTDTDQAIAE